MQMHLSVETKHITRSRLVKKWANKNHTE